MAINTSPLFVGKPKMGTALLQAANIAVDGTGTAVPLYTADATYGSFIDKIILTPRGTNVQTVARVFLVQGAVKTLLAEATLQAATTVQTAAQNSTVINLQLPLPAGASLEMTLGTAVASGFSVVAVGGDYINVP